MTPEIQIPRILQMIVKGRLDDARIASTALLATHPSHAGALIQRSRLESSAGHYRLAREYALAAWGAGVRNKRQCMLVLRGLRAYNLIPELHDLVSSLPPELTLDPDVARQIATLFESLNQARAALDISVPALQHTPDSASLHFSVGFAQLNLGDFDAAERHLLECLRLDPGNASAWWQLSRLRTSNAANHHVDPLRSHLEQASEPLQQALLGFTLHKELDDLGEYADAARALEQACLSMKRAVPYSSDEDERLFAALKSLPAGEPATSVSRDAEFTPIFIVGMHRSGTTLLEQLLSGHDEIRSGGELYDFTSQLRHAADHHCMTELDLKIVQAASGFDYDAIGRGYLDSVAWRRDGHRFVTDKLPSNFLNLGFILRALPHAKVLHMSREPMETCFSNLRQPFSEHTCRYSYDQTELGNYYRGYFSLMQHWRQRFPGRIHDVTYTTLARNPEAELKRVSSYLGIEYQSSMLIPESRADGVTTASAVQVRQSVALPDQPKWSPYREFLTPLEWRLADVGQRY